MSALDRPYVFSAGSAAPPLLLLHGTGGDEHDLVPLGQHVAPGSALLSPRGSVLEGTMPRFFRRLAEGVFDEDDLRLRAGELADFVRAAEQEHGVARGSLVALGFSNGANTAAALLLLHPGLLAGAVLMAVGGPPLTEAPEADLTGTRVLVSNGAHDPMAPPDRTAALVEQLSARGAEVAQLPHGGGHAVAPEVLPGVRAWLRAEPEGRG